MFLPLSLVSYLVQLVGSLDNIISKVTYTKLDHGFAMGRTPVRRRQHAAKCGVVVINPHNTYF